MSRSATDFSCSDDSYDNVEQPAEQPAAPKVKPLPTTVVGTPAPREETPEQNDDTDD